MTINPGSFKRVFLFSFLERMKKYEKTKATTLNNFIKKLFEQNYFNLFFSGACINT